MNNGDTKALVPRCATPRSGSTLLCEALTQTGVAGRPQEYFEVLRHSGLPREPREYFTGVADPGVLSLLPATQPARPAAEGFAARLATVAELGTTPNGVFGAKLMWGHLNDLAARAREVPRYAEPAGADLLAALFGGPAYVLVTRHDKVAQAVSLWRAVQTRAWRAGSGEGRTAVYHFGAIDHLVSQLSDQDERWRRWVAAADIEPVVVTYEALAERHEETVARVLRHLGILAPALPEAPLERQGDARSDAWAHRYRRERAARVTA
jgi:trehalose 2-sulfotransferase